MSLDLSIVCNCCDFHIFTTNITHNLVPMAKACGLYDCMWNADDLDKRSITDLIAELSVGIDELSKNRTKYELMTPSNNWGSYDGLLRAALNFHSELVMRSDKDITITVCK